MVKTLWWTMGLACDNDRSFSAFGLGLSKEVEIAGPNKVYRSNGECFDKRIGV